jgi:glycosyltransferase involved in cell wall biosynthesis
VSKLKHLVVVVPCYNEEETLPHLISALQKVRSSIKEYSIDVLLVNDGSTDKTQQTIEKICSNDDQFFFVSLANNAGHQSALRAGINKAVNYDAAIMMDADMQHPPELIPRMIDAWVNGAKIVQMVRSDTATEAGALKYLTSKSYYRVINALSSINLEYGASDFRLIDKLVIETVACSKEKDLFLRGYFSWLPVPKKSIPYIPQKRIAGSSKYSFRKMMSLAYEGILQFSEKPLLMAVVVGATLSALSLIYGLVIIIRYILGAHLVSGWTSLMVTVLFCFGINFMLIGIIGAYLAHAIRLEKQRPEFIVASEKTPKT